MMTQLKLQKICGLRISNLQPKRIKKTLKLTMKRYLLWIGLAISAILIIVSLRALKLDEVLESVKNANLLWLLPSVVVYFIAVYLRGLRWAVLIRPRKIVRPAALFPIIVIGYMGNNIYPARIGELVRAYVLRKKEGIPIAYSFATVLLERIVDGLVMVGFVLLGLPQVSNLPDTLRSFIFIAALLFIVAIGIFIVLALYPTVADRLAQSIISRVVPHKLQAPLLHFINRFVEGAQSLRSPIDLLTIMVYSIIAWLCETVKYWFVMLAFGLNLNFIALMLLNGAANLATIIPSGPGFVGTYDAASIGVLTALGVSPELGAAYTIVLHAILWLPVTLLGLFFMIREGMHWSDFKQAEQAH
jgi:hypothetical protein